MFTTSVQRSHHFGPLSSTNNDTTTLNPNIASLCVQQKILFKLCRRIVHKADSFIMFGPKFLPQSLIRKINQFNALHADEPTEQPREFSSQPLVDHSKQRTYPPKTIPMVSGIVGRLNHHVVDNDEAEVHPS